MIPLHPYVPRTAPERDELDAFHVHMTRAQRHRAATQGPPTAARAAAHATALAAEAVACGRRGVPVW